MDLSVLHKLTYGMYAVGTLDGIRPAAVKENRGFRVQTKNLVLLGGRTKNILIMRP